MLPFLETTNNVYYTTTSIITLTATSLTTTNTSNTTKKKTTSKKTSTKSKTIKPTTQKKTTKKVVSQGKTLYITPTGKKYHYDPHCNGVTYFKTTLEDALNWGLTPCKKYAL